MEKRNDKLPFKYGHCGTKEGYLELGWDGSREKNLISEKSGKHLPQNHLGCLLKTGLPSIPYTVFVQDFTME